MTGRTNAKWFFIALVGGGAAVLVVKSISPNAWLAAIVAASVVIALMIYYMFNGENAPEEEGDNIYYLGLLFTLISLMLALIQLFGVGADGDLKSNAEGIRILLQNFGIALTSTVVGIAGRIVLQNWQLTEPTQTSRKPSILHWMRQNWLLTESTQHEKTPKDSEDPTIAASPHQIAYDLTQSANALARFHRIVRGYASDSNDHLRNHSEMLKRESAEFQDTLQGNVSTFVRELKAHVESTLESVENSLGATAQQAEALLKKLQAAHDDYLAEIRETTRSFQNDIQSATSENLNALQRNSDAATTQSLSLMGSLSTVNKRIGEALDNIEPRLGQAGDASAAFGENADKAAKSAGVLEVEIEKLRTAFAPIYAGAEAMTGILDSVAKWEVRIGSERDAVQTAVAVQQIGETLQTITAEAATATENAARAAESLDALAQSIQTAGVETQRAAEALCALASETETLSRRKGTGFFRSLWNRIRR